MKSKKFALYYKRRYAICLRPRERMFRRFPCGFTPLICVRSSSGRRRSSNLRTLQSLEKAKHINNPMDGIYQQRTGTIVQIGLDSEVGRPSSSRIPRVPLEQRTVEERRAIEALAELSRRDAVIIMPLSSAGGEINSLLAKRKAAEIDFSTLDIGRNKKRARHESVVTVDKDIGPIVNRRYSRATTNDSNIASARRFQTVIGILYDQISQQRNANLFHEPVKDSEAPDYREIIRRPMDLKTIKAKIKVGNIGNSHEFERDVYIVFANAMMYNSPNSDVYRLAKEMMFEYEKQIKDFRQTADFV